MECACSQQPSRCSEGATAAIGGCGRPDRDPPDRSRLAGRWSSGSVRLTHGKPRSRTEDRRFSVTTRERRSLENFDSGTVHNQMAKNTYMSGGNVSVPMVLTAAVGGTYNDAAQHSQTLYGTFAHVPGMKVVVPSTAYEAKGLMHNAIRDDDPVVYLFHKRLMGIGWLPAPDGPKTPVPEDGYTIPFGSADVKREGEDATIVTLGLHVHRALDAAESLAEAGISAEVVDLRSLVPLDTDTIVDSVEKTGNLVVVDEDYRSYGVTGEVVASVADEALGALEAVERVAIPDVPIPYSRPLENEVVPDVSDIEAAVKRTQ
nr:transketolase C-terminal domain-containing protein [Halobellus ruber]